MLGEIWRLNCWATNIILHCKIIHPPPVISAPKNDDILDGLTFMLTPFSMETFNMLPSNLQLINSSNRLIHYLGPHNARFNFVVNFQKLLRCCIADIHLQFERHHFSKKLQGELISELADSTRDIQKIFDEIYDQFEPENIGNGVEFMSQYKIDINTITNENDILLLREINQGNNYDSRFLLFTE